ncbi:uncharacterized protein IL334_003822 [Kwoniella shivajii]|uniref:HNH nuclease domain-containing protein n=1 Tax=Kwoniella shivajii TaxID=564305 RepID=A0ABZ1D0E8_9TREE|nr:hypothetical protein IL334_003822 [Kwoniella shivajii]
MPEIASPVNRSYVDSIKGFYGDRAKVLYMDSTESKQDLKCKEDILDGVVRLIGIRDEHPKCTSSSFRGVEPSYIVTEYVISKTTVESHTEAITDESLIQNQLQQDVSTGVTGGVVGAVTADDTVDRLRIFVWDRSIRRFHALGSNLFSRIECDDSKCIGWPNDEMISLTQQPSFIEGNGQSRGWGVNRRFRCNRSDDVEDIIKVSATSSNVNTQDHDISHLLPTDVNLTTYTHFIRPDMIRRYKERGEIEPESRWNFTPVWSPKKKVARTAPSRPDGWGMVDVGLNHASVDDDPGTIDETFGRISGWLSTIEGNVEEEGENRNTSNKPGWHRNLTERIVKWTKRDSQNDIKDGL